MTEEIHDHLDYAFHCKLFALFDLHAVCSNFVVSCREAATVTLYLCHQESCPIAATHWQSTLIRQAFIKHHTESHSPIPWLIGQNKAKGVAN